VIQTWEGRFFSSKDHSVTICQNKNMWYLFETFGHLSFSFLLSRTFFLFFSKIFPFQPNITPNCRIFKGKFSEWTSGISRPNHTYQGLEGPNARRINWARTGIVPSWNLSPLVCIVKEMNRASLNLFILLDLKYHMEFSTIHVDNILGGLKNKKAVGSHDKQGVYNRWQVINSIIQFEKKKRFNSLLSDFFTNNLLFAFYKKYIVLWKVQFESRVWWEMFNCCHHNKWPRFGHPHQKRTSQY